MTRPDYLRDFATQSGVSTQGSRILSQPEAAVSIYDPAIQESGVLFGNRGVESAPQVADLMA